jgi:hypothetical protein
MKKVSFFERLRKLFGPSPKTAIENSINRTLRDIDEIRKKTDSPANRIALDNAKKILETMKDRASEYNRAEVDSAVENMRTLIVKIRGTSDLSESMGTYISLLINYVSNFMAGGAERENTERDLANLLQDAEIIRKNEMLECDRDAKTKERDKHYDDRRKKEEQQNKIGALLESPDVVGAEYDKLNDDFDNLEEDIDGINSKIEAVNEEIRVITEDIRDNEKFAVRLRRVKFLKKQLTSRAFNSVEEYEAVVTEGNKLAEDHEDVHRTIDDIEKSNARPERQKKENPKKKEIEMKRMQNIRAREAAEEDKKNFDIESERDNIKNG